MRLDEYSNHRGIFAASPRASTREAAAKNENP